MRISFAILFGLYCIAAPALAVVLSTTTFSKGSVHHDLMGLLFFSPVGLFLLGTLVWTVLDLSREPQTMLPLEHSRQKDL